MNTCHLTNRIQVKLVAIKKICPSWLSATSMHLRKCVCVCVQAWFFWVFFTRHSVVRNQHGAERTKAHSDISTPQSHATLRGKRKRWLSSAQQQLSRREMIRPMTFGVLFLQYYSLLVKVMVLKKSILKFEFSATIFIFPHSTAVRQMLGPRMQIKQKQHHGIVAFGFIGSNTSWAAILTQSCTFSFDFPLDPRRLLLNPFQPYELWQWWISLLVAHHIVSLNNKQWHAIWDSS